MKKQLILLFLTAMFSFGHAQPNISKLEFPSSVDLFGLYEIAFQMEDYSNPYDPDVIDVHVNFIAPDGKTFTVNGFYYEEYRFEQQKDTEVAISSKNKGWRVRFTPDQTGTWTFNLHAIDRHGEKQLSSVEGNPCRFICKAVDNAQGFISIANTYYMKRESVLEGQRQHHPFYPTGPNIAWYGYNESSRYPKGIFGYEKYIDSIAGSVNYMRIWLTSYPFLNLYGPEYTQKVGGKPIMYFNSTLNQKDAAELDHIIGYAASHDICIMPCIFTFGDFCYKNNSSSNWDNNPFHTILGLKDGTEFFTNPEAKRISKNLIRYIIARWGYATNIICWEFWNEVDNIPNGDLKIGRFQRNIVDWHKEMAKFTRSIDPFNHPLTTSITSFSEEDYLCSRVYRPLDIVQCHTYGNIQKARSAEQRSHQLFNKRSVALKLYSDKPFFVGEFGFGQNGSAPKYEEKDPYGFDTHNCLWASCFSTSMGPASFWFWTYLEKKDLMRIYEPVFRFLQNLPLLSSSFTAHHTAENDNENKHFVSFPNSIQTYYMINATEDTLYGWCQDTAYSYQSLRRLADHVGKNGHFDDKGVFDANGYVYTLNQAKKPKPSSNSNVITLPIKKQPVGAQYIVRWYDSETGLEIATEKTTATVKQERRRNYYISFEFPSTIRDLKQNKINNTFGDAVFSIVLDKNDKKGSKTEDPTPNDKSNNSTYKIKANRRK